MAVLIKGGRVIDPAKDFNKIADVLVEQGLVKAVGSDLHQGLDSQNLDVVEAEGLLVMPGLIDVHCHLREPGFEYKESIETGTRAAVRGGFTTLCSMPNTNPVCDNQTVVQYILSQAKEKGLARVHPIGAVTKSSKGEELSEMGDMAASGAVAFSDDGLPVARSTITRLALEYAKMIGKTIITHAEDKELAGEGVMHEGYWSTVLGLRGIPPAAEASMVARDILLAEAAGASLHIAHVSTKQAVELIRWGQSKGIDVTGEVCPHHLALTDAAVEGFDTATKVNPPLRSQEHVQALKEGLQDGTLTILATDHAPHAKDEKDREYAYAPFGISGLETAWALCWKELVETGLISVEKMVAMFTCNPAKRFSLVGGTISVGDAADITVIDPKHEETVTLENWQSKGLNTPFLGWTMRSWPVMTMVGGKIVMKNRKVIKN